MSSNWIELKKELNVLSNHSKSRKRKLSENSNKWKKLRREIEIAEQAKEGEEKVDSLVTGVLAIDCEYVGVGFNGLENMLARVSIVNIEGHPIYDKYVQPTEKVTDYRTDVSGIRPGHLTRGVPFTQVQCEVKKILSNNILVGHSINNDFKVLGLIHPPKLVRDTAKYKPLRETLGESNKTPSLKLLAHSLLGVQIQHGEHDSVTDAKIALRIYLKHRMKWENSLKGRKHK